MPITSRKIIKFGASKSIILPPDWFRTHGLKERDKITIVYDSIAVILPPRIENKAFIVREFEHLLNQAEASRVEPRRKN